MYQSTKTYDHNVGFSCAFRQWRADSHCRFLHGYALAFKFVFEADTLDYRNWVVDFGGLDTLKGALRYWFDHTTVVAADDPYLHTMQELNRDGIIQLRELPHVGCEAFAEYAYNLAIFHLTDLEPRVRVVSCEVREHGANSAIYCGE